MISRRRFLALLSVAPPVCKTLLACNAKWEQFANELSRALSNLQKGQFLIIETKADLYYVQFAGGGIFGMRAESVSNGYLYGLRKLSDEANVLYTNGLERQRPLVREVGLLPNFPPFISRDRRLFRPPGAVEFPVL